MINVQICTGGSPKQIFVSNELLTLENVWNQFEQLTNLSRANFYILHNGRTANQNDTILDGCATIVPKLLGGKGGFGSMLRAIGAQIEKTTNREACRDLSGRRLRDINEEKRLKAWIEKQSKREEEAAERKKKKLQRLCAEPKHEFKDHNYEKERSVLTERIEDAVEAGFKAAVAGSSSVKRKCEEEVKSNKKKIILDLDIDSDELDTSDDSEAEDVETKKQDKSEQQVSNDSGNSSDETDKDAVNLNEKKDSDSNTSGNQIVQTDSPPESIKEETTNVNEKISTEVEDNEKSAVVISDEVENKENDKIINHTDTVVSESKCQELEK